MNIQSAIPGPRLGGVFLFHYFYHLPIAQQSQEQCIQVSRLLEYAAAMSSAQEKVTGSPRLDMAGVMAALAMARQEEVKSKTGGQRSFLHDNYKRSDGLVRAEYVETSMEEAVSGAKKNVVRSEERTGDHLALLSGRRGVKNTVQLDDSSSRSERGQVSECRAAFENMTGSLKKSQTSLSSSSSVESSPRQENKWSSLNPQKSSPGVAKCLNQANTHTEVGQMVGDMSGFLSVVERLSEEKESRTGNGRLDMSELVSALNTFQSGQATAPTPAPAPVPTTAPAPTPAAAPTPAPPLPARPPPTTCGGPPRPPPPPVSVPKHSHVERQESSQTMNTSKYSFQKSRLIPDTEKREHAIPGTHHASFTAEKDCLIGELKSKMNQDNNSKEDTKQHKTLPRRNLQAANPSQEQMVKKIVYNQYREMLNSYRNNK